MPRREFIGELEEVFTKIRVVCSGYRGQRKNEEVQSSLFLHIIGEEALAIYNTFKFERQGDEKKLQCIKAKFEAYCNPKKNLTVERHVFFTRAQNEGESIDTYVTDLKNKSKTCEFGNLEESLITDRIVCGIRSTELRERLLRETDLTLSKALTICRAAELSKTGVKDLQKSLAETTTKCDEIRGQNNKKSWKTSVNARSKQPNKQPIPSNSRPTETSTSERTQKGSKNLAARSVRMSLNLGVVQPMVSYVKDVESLIILLRCAGHLTRLRLCKR